MMGLAYQYSDIELSVVKQLNTKILNKAFVKLIANDKSSIPACNYQPSIWECKWYNNQNILGYDVGDSIWKHTYTHLSDFLADYGDRVYAYAQENDRLQSYLVSSWTTITESTLLPEEYQIWEDRYWNVISGYSEVTEWEQWDPEAKEWKTYQGKKQFFGPLFDYGDRNLPEGAPQPRLEIYASTKSNNKDPLSCPSWKSIVLSSQAEYDNYISTEVDLLFSQHLAEYHLSGQMKPSEVNEVLIANNLSNFDISKVDSVLKLRTHDQFINTEGFDVVKSFVKHCTDNRIDSRTTVKTYQWYRLWNSGYLEHGGTVYCAPKSSITDPLDYSLCVQLDWVGINGAKAPVYDYPETTELFYGNDYNELNYSESRYGTEHMSKTKERWLTDSRRYSVQVTPIQCDIKQDMTPSGKFKDPTQLMARSYPETPSEKNKNHPYLNVEVHHMKNNSFCITRNNIDDDLSSNSEAQFYSYYVTGFRVAQT